eukprot:5510656-Amphidinium_carterae.1
MATGGWHLHDLPFQEAHWLDAIWQPSGGTAAPAAMTALPTSTAMATGIRSSWMGVTDHLCWLAWLHHMMPECTLPAHHQNVNLRAPETGREARGCIVRSIRDLVHHAMNSASSFARTPRPVVQ